MPLLDSLGSLVRAEARAHQKAQIRRRDPSRALPRRPPIPPLWRWGLSPLPESSVCSMRPLGLALAVVAEYHTCRPDNDRRRTGWTPVGPVCRDVNVALGAPNTGFIIRDMRPEDKDAVLAYSQDTWEWGDYLPRVLDQWLLDPRSTIRLAATESDEPIGSYRYSRLSDREGWLSGLRVRTDVRGQGVAGLLLEDAIAMARHDGLRVLRYASEITNEAVTGLSRVYGFAPRGTWLTFERVMEAIRSCRTKAGTRHNVLLSVAARGRAAHRRRPRHRPPARRRRPGLRACAPARHAASLSARRPRRRAGRVRRLRDGVAARARCRAVARDAAAEDADRTIDRARNPGRADAALAAAAAAPGRPCRAYRRAAGGRRGALARARPRRRRHG